jgi:hypothetical protein
MLMLTALFSYLHANHIAAFVFVIIAQLIFFLVHTAVTAQWKNVWRFLWRGMLAGVPFGLAFDLIIGKYAGIHSYTFGFSPYFLPINGLLSFGLMMANVLLLKHSSFLHIYAWSVLLGMVYEGVNLIAPVWIWTFGEPFRVYVTVIGAGYAGLTWLMMLSLHNISSVSFKILTREYYRMWRLW